MGDSTMISAAILSLAPGSQWSMTDEEYSTLVWDENNTQPKPSLEEVQAEAARLKSIYDAKEYQRKRAEAYPSFADQLDLLYHGGYDAWKAAIDEVKAQYPKVNHG
jgi:hypothetical protein